MDWVIRPTRADDIPVLALIGAATFLETFADFHAAAEIVAYCGREYNALSGYSQSTRMILLL